MPNTRFIPSLAVFTSNTIPQKKKRKKKGRRKLEIEEQSRGGKELDPLLTAVSSSSIGTAEGCEEARQRGGSAASRTASDVETARHGAAAPALSPPAPCTPPATLPPPPPISSLDLYRSLSKTLEM